MDDAWAAVREACAAVGYTPAGPVTEVYEVTRADGVPPERVRHPGPASLRPLTRSPAVRRARPSAHPDERLPHVRNIVSRKTRSPLATTACLSSAGM